MRLRVRVRTLMIGVAIAALLSGGEILQRRSQAFQKKALLHEALENYDMSVLNYGTHLILRPDFRVEIIATVPETPSHHTFPGDIVESIRQCAEYHSRMKAKYEAAARRPWIQVEPDPEIPD
jgi:hypothetical protein